MDCSKCKRTDVKCCYTCQKDADKCKVYHKCGSDCPEYETRAITNADRIRSMTDEELATFFDCGISDISMNFNCEECNNRLNCDVCYLEWLQSEAE